MLAAGFIPLSLSWNFPALRYFVFAYDVLLVAIALIDYFISRKLPEELTVTRQFDKRFAIGEEAQIKLHIENAAPQTFNLQIKDEFPPEMKLSTAREAKFKIEGQTFVDFFYNLTPPRRGRYEFGKTAVPVHSEHLPMSTKVRITSAAADALAAWHNRVADEFLTNQGRVFR